MIDRDTGWYFMGTSIKGIVIDPSGRVLLGRNPRDEWELPGGWPDLADDGPESTVLREISEEAGLAVEVVGLVDCAAIDVGAEGKVLIVSYLCRADSFENLTLGHEHKYFRAFAPEELEVEALHPTYRRAIQLAYARAEATWR